MPLYLSEADVTGLITPGEAVPVLEQCFLRMASGAVDNVPRRRLALDDGGFAVMSAVDRDLGYAGVKAYTVVAGKAVFAVSLFDLRTGELAAVLEADTAGQRRSGAASAVRIRATCSSCACACCASAAANANATSGPKCLRCM